MIVDASKEVEKRGVCWSRVDASVFQKHKCFVDLCVLRLYALQNGEYVLNSTRKGFLLTCRSRSANVWLNLLTSRQIAMVANVKYSVVTNSECIQVHTSEERALASLSESVSSLDTAAISCSAWTALLVPLSGVIPQSTRCLKNTWAGVKLSRFAICLISWDCSISGLAVRK